MNIVDFSRGVVTKQSATATCTCRGQLSWLQPSHFSSMKALLLFMVVTLLEPYFLAGSRFSNGNDPSPNPKSVVKHGKARFTVLTDHLIRMEWDPNGQVNDAATFVFLNRNLPTPVYNVTQQANGIIIQTSALKVPLASVDPNQNVTVQKFVL